MFTGLVECRGTVRRLARSGAGAVLELEASWPGGGHPATGDSVAVNGACLTVLEPGPAGLTADLSPETLSRTTLGRLRAGEPVNLERSLRLGDRLGGHLVLGHVDAVVRLVSTRPEGSFVRWRVSLPREQAPEVAPKGSLALHGVSLTVATLGDGWFEVALIPETLRSTVLGSLATGAELHLETDVLAKYVRRAVGGDGAPGSLLAEFLGGGLDATD